MDNRKLFPMYLKYITDELGVTEKQQLSYDEDQFKDTFEFDNLIFTDMTADTFIYAVLLGMDLRDAGYDDVEVRSDG